MARRLVGVREIAKLLGTSRQRADQLVRTKGFPDPLVELASGRIWARSAVVRWAKAEGRSVPWATVELELEQIAGGAAASAANIYRMTWEVVRMKALGRNRDGAPVTREGAHELALAEAHKVDPKFDVHAPAVVDDLEDETANPLSRMLFRGTELWFVRAGDSKRGYWHLEWDGHEWWLRECFTADGSGWNLRSRRAFGWCPSDSGLEAFLRRELVGGDVPMDISEELVGLAIEHASAVRGVRG
jgi:predicted DNA-binding transcriptional regulator AlpA